jgi:hypothetical protein
MYYIDNMPVFTFSNPSPIYLKDKSNIAIPFPSLITAFALPDRISEISVHIYGLYAESLENIAILLVAPNSKYNLVLFNGIDTAPYPQPIVDISILDRAPYMPIFGPLLNDWSYRPTTYSSFPYVIEESESNCANEKSENDSNTIKITPILPPKPYNDPPFFGKASFFSSFIEPKIQLNGIWGLYIFSKNQIEIEVQSENPISTKSNAYKLPFAIKGGWSISFYHDIPSVI